MADSKLADLTAITTPATTDILYLVHDPAGTPVDRKVTVANLRGASGSGAVLGRTAYNPGTGVSASRSATSFTDLDATNAKVSFTAPSSGNVTIRAKFIGQGTTANAWLRVNLRDASGDVAGTDRYVTSVGNASGTAWAPCSVEFDLTGLTPGMSYTYKLGFASETTSAVRMLYGAFAGLGSSPLVIEAMTA